MAIDGTNLSPDAAATLAKLQAEQAARNAALTSSTPGSTTAVDKMGKDTFLKLLVAQLKYQNPMQPSDPSAFMAQTAQFSMVEKLEAMEKATTELVSSERARAAVSLLGNQVTWTGSDGTPASGVVTGIRTSSEGPVLEVGDKDVPYNTVTKVTAAPVAPKDSGTTTSSTTDSTSSTTDPTSTQAPAA